MVDGEEQWTVEQLLVVAGDEVQVKWAGWEDTTWEPDQIRADCPGLLADLLLSDQTCNDQCQQQKHLSSVASVLDLIAAELRRKAQEHERKAFLARKRAVESDNISRAITHKKFKLKTLLYPDKRAKQKRTRSVSTPCPAYKFANLPRKSRNKKDHARARTDRNEANDTSSQGAFRLQQLRSGQNDVLDKPIACHTFSLSLRPTYYNTSRNAWPAVNNLQSQRTHLG
jgi:hypothetical protein